VARAETDEMVSPHPLGAHLPALYQAKDPFALGLAAAFDGVLAPIFASLDNFDSYLDPALAPPDFLEWLGTWVGLVLDESWSPERQRALVSAASALYRVRGTVAGLKAHLELVTGTEVLIEDSGATGWSTESGNPFPGRPDFQLTVRLPKADGGALDAASIDALVAASKPANVKHRVLVADGSAPDASAPSPGFAGYSPDCAGERLALAPQPAEGRGPRHHQERCKREQRAGRRRGPARGRGQGARFRRGRRP
jgi:phage tail-like protein